MTTLEDNKLEPDFKIDHDHIGFIDNNTYTHRGYNSFQEAINALIEWISDEIGVSILKEYPKGKMNVYSVNKHLPHNDKRFYTKIFTISAKKIKLLLNESKFKEIKINSN